MNDQERQERPFDGFSDTSNYDGALQDGQFYPAILRGVKERNIERGDFPGWKVIWGFVLTLPNGNTEPLEGMSSQATGPDSKAGDWLVGLLGQARYDERGSRRITPDELRDKPCKVYVKFAKGWPRVGGVFPAEQTTATPPPPPTAPPPAPAQTPPPASGPPPPANTAADYDDLPF